MRPQEPMQTITTSQRQGGSAGRRYETCAGKAVATQRHLIPRSLLGGLELFLAVRAVIRAAIASTAKQEFQVTQDLESTGSGIVKRTVGLRCSPAEAVAIFR